MPSSIILGSIENPLKPELNCTIRDIQVGTDEIQTCLCTFPFCNDLVLEHDDSTTAESRLTAEKRKKFNARQSQPPSNRKRRPTNRSGKAS